jgi:long-chain acyl-CoA synthetase
MLLTQTAERYGAQNCLGYRPFDTTHSSYGEYQWFSYATVANRRKDLGAGLMKLYEDVCASPLQGGVGLWCTNRPDWQIVDLGCMSQSLYTVSIYETLGSEATEHIINQAALSVICASPEHLETLAGLAPRCPSLKFLVALSDNKPDWELSIPSKMGNLPVFTISYVETTGKKSPRSFSPPTPESIVTINYTSGTTGMPKGVVLTHKAAVAAASCAISIVDLHEKDRICSFLPLAHIFQRVTEAASLWAGSSIGYYHGDVQALVDDFKFLQPTNMINVPRVYSRLGAGIKAKMAQVASTMPDQPLPVGLNLMIAKGLGLDSCRTMVSGSAPIDPALQAFLRGTMNNTFKQGYGLTETYAITLAQVASDDSVGTCGAVLPAVEICLQDDSDLGYTSSDHPNPRGELLIRSTTLFSGYYLNPVATAESFTEDGWFRSGDICEIDKRGRVQVIDRRKNMLKLSQGEYISPERIENIMLSELPWVTQIMVHGDSTESFLVAIIGVDQVALTKLLETSYADTPGESIDGADGATDYFRLPLDDRVLAAVLTEIRKVELQNGSLKGFERIKAVTLLKEPFSVENELLTPT